ncbi:MAG: hypothetical protein WD010_08085 [Nitriliruptor sp.]|uniref:hypothetical protein n=1 Tax=Nitriliruptor sp. TaxID=2448056 RepID=UPI00349FDC5D
MADRDAPDGLDTSPRLDRVRTPDPKAPRPRDTVGKEALYSTAPSAAPSSPVLVRCRKCDIETGVSVGGFARLLKLPVLWNPVSRRLWTRCPACDRRTWLYVRQGQALRALLAGRATRS